MEKNLAVWVWWTVFTLLVGLDLLLAQWLIFHILAAFILVGKVMFRGVSYHSLLYGTATREQVASVYYKRSELALVAPSLIAIVVLTHYGYVQLLALSVADAVLGLFLAASVSDHEQENNNESH